MNGSVSYARATYFLVDDLGKKNDSRVPSSEVLTFSFFCSLVMIV
jgi:hypothetical protein